MRRPPQLSRGEMMGPGLGWCCERERKETVGRQVKEAESIVVADSSGVGRGKG